MEIPLRNLRRLVLANQIMGAVFLLFGIPMVALPFLSAFEIFNDRTSAGGIAAATVIWVLPLALGGAFSLIGTVGYCLGILLWKRVNLQVCRVMAVMLCLFIPLGTIMGSVTLIFLRRPETAWVFSKSGVADRQ